MLYTSIASLTPSNSAPISNCKNEVPSQRFFSLHQAILANVLSVRPLLKHNPVPIHIYQEITITLFCLVTLTIHLQPSPLSPALLEWNFRSLHW